MLMGGLGGGLLPKPESIHHASAARMVLIQVSMPRAQKANHSFALPRFQFVWISDVGWKP